MKRMTITAGALLSLAGAALALAPARQLMPGWNKGDTWAVQTQFRKMAHRDGNDQLSWSEPVTFVYTVADRSDDGTRTTYRIHAEPRAANSGFATDVTLVAEAGHLAVSGVETHHRRQGRDVADTQSFPAPMPVFTESSVIPYDAPVFPLTQASDLNASNFINAKRKFQRVETAGGLKFAHVQSQRVLPAGATSSYLDADGKPVDFAVPVEASRVFPVEMAEETTGQKVTQYWAEGLPWAVYSENGSSRSWLVK